MAPCASVFRLPAPSDVSIELRRTGFVFVPEALSRADVRSLANGATRLVETGAARIERPSAEAQRSLSYRVVPGDRIRAEFPALFDLYTSTELVDWIRTATDPPAITISPHLRSGININCLSRAGQQYRRHVDAVPYTVVLFLTSITREAGGQLQINATDGTIVDLEPRAGGLVLMDGARCPHAVAPLRQDVMRLTVPMVYPARAHERPSGLDEFLYGQSARQRRST